MPITISQYHIIVRLHALSKLDDSHRHAAPNDNLGRYHPSDGLVVIQLGNMTSNQISLRHHANSLHIITSHILQFKLSTPWISQNISQLTGLSANKSIKFIYLLLYPMVAMSVGTS